MKMKKVLLSTLALSLIAGIGCSQRLAENDPVVAQVGNEKITQSDIDFLKESNPDPYAKAGQESAALEYLIESRLVFQAAGELVGKDNPELGELLQNIEEKLLAQAYNSYYIARYLGASDADLQRYFESHRATFAKDSCSRLSACREAVAQAFYIEKNAEDFKKFVADQEVKSQLSTVEIAYVQSADMAQVAKAEQDLIARKIPLDSIPGLKRATFLSNDTAAPLSIGGIYDSLFVKSLYVGSVRRVRGNGEEVAFRILLRSEAPKLPEEPAAKDSALKARFINEYQNFQLSSGDSLLRERYGFQIEKIHYAEVKKYFDEHADEFAGKNFEDVEQDIEWKLSKNSELPLDSERVLATLFGKPFILERDAQKLLEEIPPKLRVQYPRARRVWMLAEMKLRAKAARDAHLESSQAFQKISRDTKVSFYRKAFADSLGVHGFFVSEDSLKAAYEKFGTVLYPGKPFEKVRAEMGILAQAPDRAVRYEYYRNAKKLVPTANADSMRLLVFPVVSQKFSWSRFERYRKNLFVKYPVTVYDSVYLPRNDLYSASYLVARADSFYQAQNLSGARLTWDRVRYLSETEPSDSLYRTAAYWVAKIDNEREKFELADDEYAAYIAMWPDSPEAENALFSRGYLLRENLKQDSLALEILDQFLKKYPKSDLAESADWIVRDIRSGGKLSSELMQKIASQEENDN